MRANELAQWEDIKDVVITCTDGDVYFCDADYFYDGDDNDAEDDVAFLEIKQNRRTNVWPKAGIGPKGDKWNVGINCDEIACIEIYADYIKRIQNE